jgi:hypothetical protein
MPEAKHIEGLKPCPFLPEVEEPLRAAEMKKFGRVRGEAFYLRALECAQSLWLQGLPAQSILLMNRAFGSDLDGTEEVLKDWPLPFDAMVWVMANREEEHFIGNPRRHFQHLATRMVEPRRELRTWRAWACWFLACGIFPDFPADDKQLLEEGVVEPEGDEIGERLAALGLPGEADLWRAAIEGLSEFEAG